MKINHLLPITALTALVGLSSCSSVRDTLGLERKPPNEYDVAPSQVDLEMPPDFYKLPAPQPGAPRPQEVSQSETAKQLLAGNSSHTPNHDHASTQSAGTLAFLEEAGVQSGHDAIRYELYQEAEVEKRKGGTVAQQLGIEKRNAGNVLKPVEEQSRLRKAGIETSKYVDETVDDDQ